MCEGNRGPQVLAEREQGEGFMEPAGVQPRWCPPTRLRAVPPRVSQEARQLHDEYQEPRLGQRIGTETGFCTKFLVLSKRHRAVCILARHCCSLGPNNCTSSLWPRKGHKPAPALVDTWLNEVSGSTGSFWASDGAKGQTASWLCCSRWRFCSELGTKPGTQTSEACRVALSPTAGPCWPVLRVPSKWTSTFNVGIWFHSSCCTGQQT